MSNSANKNNRNIDLAADILATTQTASRSKIVIFKCNKSKLLPVLRWPDDKEFQSPGQKANADREPGE